MEIRVLSEPLESLDLLENTGAYKQFRYGRQGPRDSSVGSPEAPPAAELDEIWSTV